MLILTIMIPTIIYVGKNIIQQPTETAEIEKQEESDEEKISAASVKVEAGDSYTIPKDGIYKIELHGGKSEDIKLKDGTIMLGNKGSKVTGYISLRKGNVLKCSRRSGGHTYGPDLVISMKSCYGANGVCIENKSGVTYAYASRWTRFIMGVCKWLGVPLFLLWV